MLHSSTHKRLVSLLAVFLLLITWEVAARLFQSGNLLPGPWLTVKILFSMISQQVFWLSVLNTLLRGLVGFMIAGIAALLVGIPAGLSRLADALFSPVLSVIRSTPVISIILLALIWFKVEQVPVFIGFLTMFPILTTNIAHGIQSLDKSYIAMAKVYQISPQDTLRKIYLPGISPFIYSALVTATGFGWRAIIIGEVLSQPKYGIGSMMQQAQSYLLVGEVISWTVVAVVIGYGFEKIIGFARRRINKWDHHD